MVGHRASVSQDLEGQRRIFAQRRRLVERRDAVEQPSALPLDRSPPVQERCTLRSLAQRQGSADELQGSVHLRREPGGFDCRCEAPGALRDGLAERRGSLERSRRRGVTAAQLRPSTGRLERVRDLLVRGRGRHRPVPDRALSLVFVLQCSGQGGMGAPAPTQRRGFIDDRAYEWMAEAQRGRRPCAPIPLPRQDRMRPAAAPAPPPRGG